MSHNYAAISRLTRNPTTVRQTSTVSDSDCSTAGRTGDGWIIATQADADALSNCTYLNGDLVITGNQLTALDLGGIEQISGSLSVQSCHQLLEISGPALQRVSDNFTLTDLPVLTNLYFPAWGIFDGGNLTWDSCPSLTNVKFQQDALTVNHYVSVDISNTNLSTFSFLAFDGETSYYTKPQSVGTLRIRNNPQVSVIEFPDLLRCEDLLEFSSNGPATQVILPHLTIVSNLTISNAISIDISELSTISGSLRLSNNDFPLFSAPNLTQIKPSISSNQKPTADLIILDNTFQAFSTPNLETIFGNIIIQNNSNLTSLEFPKLWSIPSSYGDLFIVSNNSALEDIALPLYNTSNNVRQSIIFEGNIKNVSMPSLKILLASFSINTTDPNFDCSFFDKLHSNSKSSISSREGITYSCKAIASNSTVDVAKHWNGPSDLNVIGKVFIPIAIALIILMVVSTFIWRHKMRRVRERARVAAEERGAETELETVVGRDTNEPPAYERVGKPGEVPPGYHEPHEEQLTGSQSLSSLGEAGAESAGSVAPPAHRGN